MGAPVASALAASQAGSPAQHAWTPVVTPLGHAAPSGQSPYMVAPPATSPWTPLAHAPQFAPGTMLLESDGTVLVHVEPASGGTTNWWRLTPDKTGSYINGTWTQIASMPSGYDPLYFASAILPDGRMIVEGGEYLGNAEAWSNKGAIYNPVSNIWKAVAPPKGWTNIGDAQSDVLANGTFMLAQPCTQCTSATGSLSSAQALLNASTMTWTATGTHKADPNDEEGWNLEPSGQLLTVDTWDSPKTELYGPATGAWSNAGNTANQVINIPNAEIGPQVVMPGGNTFVVGAGTATAPPPNTCSTTTKANTAVYHDAGTTGTWSAGPQIPTFGGVQYDSADGPGTILPDGNVLFDVSQCVYLTPTHFFLYKSASNSLTQVTDPPNAPNDSTYYTRMLALPNGQILFNDGSSQMEVYTAGGTPQASWKPTIGSAPATVAPGGTYNLGGTQLAGLSQGAAYGDDVQDNTNFPLVRITNKASGVVTYARTSAWSSVSIKPGISSATKFTVPTGTPAGASTIVAVANGIASAAKAITVS